MGMVRHLSYLLLMAVEKETEKPKGRCIEEATTGDRETGEEQETEQKTGCYQRCHYISSCSSGNRDLVLRTAGSEVHSHLET